MKHLFKAEHLYTLFLKEYPDLLTTKDLQNILGISSGQIKSIKVGRNFRIPKIYLLKYLGLVPDEIL